MPIFSLRTIADRIRRFRHGTRGNISLMATTSLIPIIAAAGISLDMARMNQATSLAQTAADAAALAAASSSGTDAERAARGLAVARENLPDMYGVTLKPTVTVRGNAVSASVSVKVEGTLAAALFTQGSAGAELGHRSARTAEDADVTIVSKAFRKPARTSARCVIALDPAGAEALHISGSGSLTAEGCDIHSDSTSPTAALYRQGGADVSADAITTAGKFRSSGGGVAEPAPQEFQPQTGDPLAKFVPTPEPGGPCVDKTARNETLRLDGGVYCDLAIRANGRIELNPGTYWINGAITFSGNNPTLSGNGVTLILGPAATFEMSPQAIVQLQAAANGPHPGFLVVQKTSDTGVSHELRGGPITWLRGAWYSPEAALEIGGNSAFNADSRYFPVVANSIRTSGAAGIAVRFEHAFYGFPKIDQLHTTESSEVRLTE